MIYIFCNFDDNDNNIFVNFLNIRRWNYTKLLVERHQYLRMKTQRLIVWSYLLVIKWWQNHDSGISCIRWERWRRPPERFLMLMRYVCRPSTYFMTIYINYSHSKHHNINPKYSFISYNVLNHTIDNWEEQWLCQELWNLDQIQF